MTRRRSLLAPAAGALALVAWLVWRHDTAPVLESARPVEEAGVGLFRAQASQPKDAANQAKDFTLKDLEGKSVSLSDFRRKKVVILDFWATWCGPCRAAMPSLMSYQAKHEKDVKVFSINQLEDAGRVGAFVKNNALSLHVLLDADGAVSSAYRVFGIPTLYVVDKEGVLRAKHVGFRPDLEAYLEQVISPLL